MNEERDFLIAVGRQLAKRAKVHFDQGNLQEGGRLSDQAQEAFGQAMQFSPDPEAMIAGARGILEYWFTTGGDPITVRIAPRQMINSVLEVINAELKDNKARKIAEEQRRPLPPRQSLLQGDLRHYQVRRCSLSERLQFALGRLVGQADFTINPPTIIVRDKKELQVAVNHGAVRVEDK